MASKAAAAASLASRTLSTSAAASKQQQLAHIRLVAINDVYELQHLPKLQTFLSKCTPAPTAVVLAGDFLSPSLLASLDGGRGMVSTLRAAGLSHYCLGNHEADLQWPVLHRRLQELNKSCKWLNANVGRHVKGWVADESTPFHVIQSYCGRVRVALTGLLSDEPGMFRTVGCFKDATAPIDNMLTAYDTVVSTATVDCVIPLTHASLQRDRELATHMAEQQLTAYQSKSLLGLVIGGHEHDPIDETVCVQTDDARREASVRILKAGTNAQHASLIDLYFDAESQTTTTTTKESTVQQQDADASSAAPPAPLVQLDYELVDLANKYDNSVVVQTIATAHLQLLDELEHQVAVDCSDRMPADGSILSSERTRYQQTTVGAFLCQAAKEELGADVAILNGAPIKGNAVYSANQMTYADLRRELPFPTKMIVVEMTRAELEHAIHYSRHYTEQGEPLLELEDDEADLPPRRGYLQTDWDYYEQSTGMSSSTGTASSTDYYRSHDPDEVLSVALPRNLLKGFCKIQPLMEIGERLKRESTAPDGTPAVDNSDDFLPLLNLVLRYCSKHRWANVLRGSEDPVVFDDIDLNSDGVLDHHEVKTLLTKAFGKEPPDFVVEEMIAFVDADDNGVIDPGEFSYLLATAERDHRYW